MPVQIDGVSAAHIVVSLMTITSGPSWSLRSRSSLAKWGEPDSSSPSISSVSVTGGALSPLAASAVLAAARAPRAWKSTWPLSSEAPRPKILPSFSCGANGS